MHAFIVRPFGTKNGIDFDRVERELIRPAIEKAGFTGGTTGEILEQGNIREDMFEELLIADLVIADMSIHNANVFYELGIRHALRDKRTFLIKSKGDEVPFDLKTDRYRSYDASNPAASVDILAKALKATWDSQERDSPVYQLLPALEPVDHTKYLLVPNDFREEVERAAAEKQCGDLQLFSAELDGFAWKTAGLRLVGNAQFRLNDHAGAKVTWEAVRSYDDIDLEGNTKLGTVYQRLGDRVRSDQALERVLTHRNISPFDLAEVRALMARNAKTEWEREWASAADVQATQKAALCSPQLRKSYELYSRGFTEDRNHFYSGLNALAMVTIMVELATTCPDDWAVEFDSSEEAEQKLRTLKERRSDLAVGVRLAIESKRAALQRQEKTDIWTEISAADLAFLTASQATRVARTYKAALNNAPEFASEAARNQLLLYKRLGILTEKVQAALDALPAAKPAEAKAAPPHVILFTGHRIDAKGREKPRFPADKEVQARAMIAEAVAGEKKKSTGEILGIAGGASGGDILFHEVCEELQIPTRMFLVVPRDVYIRESVADAGPKWVERFKRLYELKKPRILSESKELPRWLRAKKDYNVWQRSNLWMLHNALFMSKENLTLIALWNGQEGDGPGGTEDMVQRAQMRGATFFHLDSRALLT
jgi:hypothetical protein